MNFSLSLPFFSVFRSPCLPPLLCPFLLLSILCPQLLLRPLAHPASIPLQLPVGRGGGGEPEQARPLLARSEPLQLHEGQKAPFLWAKDAPHQVAGLGPLSEGCQSGPACALGQGSAHNTEGRGASCLFLDLCSPTPIRPLGLQSPAGFKGKSVPPDSSCFPSMSISCPLPRAGFLSVCFSPGWVWFLQPQGSSQITCRAGAGAGNAEVSGEGAAAEGGGAGPCWSPSLPPSSISGPRPCRGERDPADLAHYPVHTPLPPHHIVSAKNKSPVGIPFSLTFKIYSN